MLLKAADDKSKDIETLQGLMTHPAITADVKRKIEQEIRFIHSGVKGERDAAYEIEFHYRSKNWAIIHDLRIQHNGRVAQIDHILVNRFLQIWVCESKRFSEGIAINEHGECTAFYGNKPYGVPSPFEQNHKHCDVLRDVLSGGAVELPTRLGFAIKPEIKSLILVSKNSRISRPKANLAGLDEILKVDQLETRLSKDFDKDYSALSLAKLISTDTLETFARRLTSLHTPITFDWHAKFGLPKATASTAPTTLQPAPVQMPVAEVAVEDKGEPEKKSKLVCSSCGVGVEYPVAKFCWGNRARFGGKVYCRSCQAQVRR